MVNVIGLGYIGLPTALILAAHGVTVVGTDYDFNRIKDLNSGSIPFEEHGLDVLFNESLSKGIQFTTQYICADFYIIAVPTPYEKNSKKIDSSYVKRAVENILSVCPKEAIIVIESTVSPGTIDKFIRPVIETRGFVIGRDVHLVHAPERIIPGNMIRELQYNSRTIGADNKEVAERVSELYKSFCKGEIVLTDIRTAEMTKVVENTFRDVNIAFANELAKICNSGNINVHEVIRIANKHPRVNILSPGPGVGGHCLAVDPWFLVGDYPTLAKLVFTARKINESMPEYVFARIAAIMKSEGIGELSQVGLYGLTYKANVDDVRESPTLQLLEFMNRHMMDSPKVYDPWVREDMVDNQYHDLKTFLTNIDLIVIMVAHQEIIENKTLLKEKTIFDTQNIIQEAYYTL